MKNKKDLVADEFSTSCCSHDLQNEGRTSGEKPRASPVTETDCGTSTDGRDKGAGPLHGRNPRKKFQRFGYLGEGRGLMV